MRPIRRPKTLAGQIRKNVDPTPPHGVSAQSASCAQGEFGKTFQKLSRQATIDQGSRTGEGS